MKKFNRSMVKTIFESAIDGESANAYKQVLLYIDNYAYLVGLNDKRDCISLKDLRSVLKELSNKWEKEIDKAIS